MDTNNLNYSQLLQLIRDKFDDELETKQTTIDTLSKQILILNYKINELQKQNNEFIKLIHRETPDKGENDKLKKENDKLNECITNIIGV
jgi:hypothetical protein